MRRRLVPTLCLSTVSFLALCGSAQAVPGLASTNNVKEVVKLLKNYSGTNAANIYQIEQQLRQRPTESAEALINVLDTNDDALKKHASQLLMRISSSNEFSLSDEAIKTLIGIMRASDDSEVQSSLVQTLGNVGPKNDSVKQAILSVLKFSPEVSVRRSAVESLAKLAREERPSLHAASTAMLIDVLKKDDAPAVRGAAAGALGNYRDNPDVAVPALTQALDDNYLQVRQRAVQALWQYGTAAKSAVPKLLDTFKTESDTSIRSSSLQALRIIDPDNESVINMMVDLLDSSDQNMAQTALNQMYSIGPKGAAAVPKLIQILKSSNRMNRMYAARALGMMGSTATAAIPALTAAAEDSDAIVRSSAQQALRQIQTQTPSSASSQ